MAMPIEKKVQASTAAAAVSGVLLWVLGRYVFKAAVPDVVTSWVYAGVPALVTFAAGYYAKHTDRPPVPPVPVPPPPAPPALVFPDPPAEAGPLADS